MTIIRRSALVMHPAKAMYELVNDVASYPLFLEGCHGVEVFEHSDSSMLARLDLKKAGVQISLMTRNNLSGNTSNGSHQIEMTLEDGPFKNFIGLWAFTPLAEDASKVSLDLEFEFKNKGLGLAASSLFSGVANNLVDSLCQRADKVLKEGQDD
ncbi:type II toxin-antitoxin system RatA family toxin [SAR92 clade bacterium H921]|nr:type II toxin-antitoxin system RatA family toxin [SAR92 clade bacterium H921]MDA9664361.1 type II toxin-antitoxin system RatA family toxin [bacterium]MDA9687406.1 type II toxin-antitoxin system RatA family toxin [bacterium]MDG0971726.1 type II toxin-antitoxin system RatA family toxin [Porticoccaceae bacterium]MDG1307994.1 type II toxin-antitoxin system RatA family toxin [Porticoccaceae bacterium]